MHPARIVHHQFSASHYTEKVRWALDWKGLPHRRVTHFPVPHALAMRRLSGQTSRAGARRPGDRGLGQVMPG